jgi:hypothetical protein
MKVKDIYGNIVQWKIDGEIISAADSRSRSKLHLVARGLLYELFPTIPILEEVSIPVKPGTTQYLDFYLNKKKLAVEVNGEQHYKFNSLFHSSAQAFLNQKKRDNEKREWCEINGITLIELPYNEDPEAWLKRLEQR